MQTTRMPELRRRGNNLATTLITARNDRELCGQLLKNEVTECNAAGITQPEFITILFVVIDRLRKTIADTASTLDLLANGPAFDESWQHITAARAAHHATHQPTNQKENQ